MKKISLLSALFCLVTLTSFGQSKNKISLSGGAALPAGDFASASKTKETAGYAKAGLYGSVSYSYSLKDRWAVEASFSVNLNELKYQDLEEQFAGNVFFPQIGQDVDWQVQHKKWKSFAYMAGVSYEIGMPSGAGKFSITPRAMVGLANVTSPAIKAEGKKPDAYIIYEQKMAKQSAPAVSVGSLFNYRLSAQLSAFLNIEYFTAIDLKFSDVPLVVMGADKLVIPGLHDMGNSANPPMVIAHEHNFRQPFSIVKAGVGLSFAF